MSALAERGPELGTLEALAGLARRIGSVEGLREVTVKIKAARELTELMEDMRSARLALMRADVAVLLRRSELRDTTLTTWDKLAVSAFTREGADGTDQFVVEHFEECGTASKLGRLLRGRHAAEDAATEGVSFAADPEARARWAERVARRTPRDEELLESLRVSRREEAANTLRGLIEAFTLEGAPFSVEDVTDAVMGQMGIPGDWETTAFRDGVRRVCREGVRASSGLSLAGGPLPSTIAVNSPAGWVRIPVRSATPADLTASLRERMGQIARDTAAAEHLRQVIDEVKRRGCGELEPISAYLPDPASGAAA